jgi:hypothetical protein
MKMCWQNKINLVLGLICLLAFSGCNLKKQVHDNQEIQALRTGCNPVISEGSADPSVRVFNDRVYIFPSYDFSRDNEFWIMKDWKVYSTYDLINFTDYGILLKFTGEDGKLFNLDWFRIY